MNAETQTENIGLDLNQAQPTETKGQEVIAYAREHLPLEGNKQPAPYSSAEIRRKNPDTGPLLMVKCPYDVNAAIEIIRHWSKGNYPEITLPATENHPASTYLIMGFTPHHEGDDILLNLLVSPTVSSLPRAE
jgi:hypothetical protein